MECSRARVRARASPSPPHARPVVVLAGGTGGAKLASGMLDLLGPEHWS